MTEKETAGGLTLPDTIRVLMPAGQVEEMPLETYLAGAIAAELGSNAPLEALKAQAVASRTYAVAARRHPEANADVCAMAHCQKWKRVDPVNAPDVFRALRETWGMVAMHGPSLINAFFFEHCDGHTRDAEAMLMPASPYLRAVDCPCGFLILKGHGVGMCKRGAIVMARRGASFDQILQHYYRGIQITRVAAKPPATIELDQVQPPLAPAPLKKARSRKRLGSHPATVPAKTPKVGRAPVASRRTAVPGSVVSEPKPSATPVRSPQSRLARPVEEQTESILPQGPSTPAGKTESSEPVPSTPQPVLSEPTTEQPKLSVKPVEVIAMEEQEAHPRTEASHSLESTVHSEGERSPSAGATSPSELAVVKPIEPSSDHAAQPLANPQAAPPSEPLSTAAVDKPITPAAPASPQATVPASDVAPAQPIEPVGQAVRPVIDESDLSRLEDIFREKAKRIHIDHLPGSRMIAGCLPRAGVVISIEDRRGNKTLVFSGSAAHYGEGGFETIVDEDGPYRVTIEGHAVEVHVQGETVFIHAD